MTTIYYDWEDCTIGFTCPECGAELIADSQNGTEECECGLKYSLSSRIFINGKPATSYEFKRQIKN